MRKGDIDRFFREVSLGIRAPVKVYLTGGVASWFLGGDRPTEDIDFGLRVLEQRGQRVQKWSEVEKLIQETSQRLGIPAQFSEDIGRWGSVGVSNYGRGAKPYKKFGKVSVYLLDVAVWSVGKINRYYKTDLEDLRSVFKHQEPALSHVIRTWAKALRESPRSSAHFLFIKTAEDFLRNYGNEIWGKGFDPHKAVFDFQKFARSK